MKTFKDTAAREWSIALHVTAVKQVRGATGVDLWDADVWVKFATDVVLLCNVLYVLCRDQATERNVSEEDFGRTLHGDPIADAAKALEDELTDFIPNSKRREAIRRGLRARAEAEENYLAAASELIEAQIRRQFDVALAKMKSAPGTAPESSESTPAP